MINIFDKSPETQPKTPEFITERLGVINTLVMNTETAFLAYPVPASQEVADYEAREKTTDDDIAEIQRQTEIARLNKQVNVTESEVRKPLSTNEQAPKPLDLEQQRQAVDAAYRSVEAQNPLFERS